MSPALIILLVVVVLVISVYLFGLNAPAKGKKKPAKILRRRSKWVRWLPVLPLLAAVGCLALAFSGFRINFLESAPTAMLTIDVSDSMDSTDMVPNRLVAAQEAAARFLEELPPDFQVGLATFAGEASLPVPPTEDRGAIVEALEQLTTSRGTVIGDGLTEALDAIEEEHPGTDAPAAVLLLSDGNDTGSRTTPHEAAERAAELGVPVFTVVVGQVVEDGNEGADLQTLQDIAATSGARTFTAETTDQLKQVYADLGSELSLDLDVRPFSTPLVIVALVLVVLAGLALIVTQR